MSGRTAVDVLFDEDVDTGLDSRPIELIHREHDGGIAFARHKGGEFEHLWSLPATGIAGVFREIVGEVGVDGYFSIHGFANLQWRSKANPKYRAAVRSSRYVRWLTAAFVDIDCYNYGKSFGDVVGKMLDLQDEGVFPPATIVVRSGRGVWFLWLIAPEPGGRKPVRALPDKVQCWNRIQSELLRRTARHLLEADAQAADIARVMRVPGSINSKAPLGSRVKFVPLLDENGEPFIYGLDQLAGLLGVKPSKSRTRKPPSEVDPARRERGFAGRRRLAEKRLGWIVRLGKLRGKFRQGTRHNAALMFAKFVLESAHDVSGVLVDAFGERLDVRRSLLNFIDNLCDKGTHPVSLDDVLSCDRFSKLRWTDKKLVERLCITDEEARAIGCPTLDEARDRRERNEKRYNRSERQTARREVLAGLLRRMTAGGELPTLETLQGMLCEHGIEATKPTIGRDWDELTDEGRAPQRRLKPSRLRSPERLLVDEAGRESIPEHG